MKNYALEGYRYFFMFFICILHIKEYYGDPYPFGGAYLAVEFFLIVSGFLLMQTIDKKGHVYLDGNGLYKGSALFAAAKFLRFYPHYLFSWSALAAYCVVVRHTVSIKELILNYQAEMLMLPQLGIGRHLNSAMWYVSALFICSVLIFYLVHKNRDRFIYIIAPVSVIAIYMYFYNTVNSLGDIGWGKVLWVNDGIFRAMAGVCIGCVVYEISISSKRWAHKWPGYRTILEVGILAFISYRFYNYGHTTLDFPIVGLLAIFVLSVMNSEDGGGSYLTKWIKRFHIDGRYVYAMYCNHWLINYAVRDFLPGLPFYPMLAGYLAVIVGTSILSTKFLDCISQINGASSPHTSVCGDCGRPGSTDVE